MLSRPAISAGIDVDNISFGNNFFSAGTCSAVPDTTSCTHAGGTWASLYTNGAATLTAAASSGDTTLYTAGTPFTAGWSLNIRDVTSGAVVYSGEIINPIASGSFTISPSLGVNISNGDLLEAVAPNPSAWVTNEESWLSALETYVHAGGGCLTSNVSWTSSSTDWANMVANLDVVFQEGGISTDRTGSAYCKPGGGYWTDTKWTGMIADFYNSGSPVNFVWNDYACSTPAASFDKIQYSLASALLIKGSYAYQTLAYVDQSALRITAPISIGCTAQPRAHTRSRAASTAALSQMALCWSTRRQRLRQATISGVASITPAPGCNIPEQSGSRHRRNLAAQRRFDGDSDGLRKLTAS